MFTSQADELIAEERFDELLEILISKYEKLSQDCDFILCEGSDYISQSSAFEFDLNRDIARNLGCPILILGNADGRQIEDAIVPLQRSYESYREKNCQVAGIILNKVEPRRLDAVKLELAEKFSKADCVLAVILYESRLSCPRVRDIAEQLHAQVLYGHRRLDRPVSNYIVAAMQMQHAITWLQENTLVITPGDRGDVIIGAMQAHQSVNYPHLAGILLSTGVNPESSIARLIEGLPDPLPVLSVETDTYTTASQLKDVCAPLTAGDRLKIDLCIRLFEEHTPYRHLEDKLAHIQTVGMTPKMFTHNLIKQAKAVKQRIVLPEGTDPRILRAASIVLSRNIANLTILGKSEEILRVINRHGIELDLGQLRIIEPTGSQQREQYAQMLYELRKHKGITPEIAREYVLDSSYFGTLMVHSGDADGMVSGAVHTTQNTIRPALQLIKTLPDIDIVSSVFFMCLEDRVIVYGDCAIVPNPTAEQLSDIAIASAETARTFGLEPKVAMLSYSSGESGKGKDVDKVRLATRIACQRRPDLEIEGPLQYDAAVDPIVASEKMPSSKVAGRATVLVFPDLNTGNNTYKAVQRETRAIAIGPVLQGLKKPVNDLSRGCTVEDIVNTVAITAIQAQRL